MMDFKNDMADIMRGGFRRIEEITKDEPYSLVRFTVVSKTQNGESKTETTVKVRQSDIEKVGVVEAAKIAFLLETGFSIEVKNDQS